MVVPQTQRPALSGTALKRLALCSMLLDHLGASCLEAGVFSRPGPIPGPLLTLDLCLRWAGRLAFPLYCFLLVEGFLHTKSFRRYLLRMLLFALVSEVPFDFAMDGKLLDWTRQNMLFTLAVGLIMLYGMKTFSASRVVQVLIAIAAVFWCALMKTQFGLCMILLIAVYYLLRDQKSKLWVGGVISLMYVTGPVSVFLLKRYNGQLGDRPNKYLFYCLYPLILLILGVITYVIA